MRSRGGFTLIELLIVTILLVVTVSALFGTLGVQQRSSQEQSAVISGQQTTRTGLAVLTSELREISAADGDLTAITKTSLTFRALGSVGFLCQEGIQDASSAWAEIWVLGDSLTKSAPVLIFVDGDASKATDDTWRTAAVANLGTPQACGSYPITQRQRLILTNSAMSGVEAGAPLRTFRPVSYGLVDMGSEWVLARQQGTDPVVELVGPLAPGGLRFTYHEADGSEVDPLSATAAEIADIAMIEILLRSQNRGATGNTHADSLITRVTLRGNPRL